MGKIINQTSSKEVRQKLRKNMSPAEKVLWLHLRKRQLAGIKFRRQVSVGKYVVDFYSFEKKLVIEVDGDSHFESDAAVEYDKTRTQYLESEGLKVVRFLNFEVIEHTDECLEALLEFLK